MQTLRNSKFIAGLVLAWFALFLGSAVAAAAVEPSGMQWVCSSGGSMQLIDTDGGEGKAKTMQGMDCPLCASVSVPRTAQSTGIQKPSPLAHALHPVAAAHIASITAPPLPSRGPPPAS